MAARRLIMIAVGCLLATVGCSTAGDATKPVAAPAVSAPAAPRVHPFETPITVKGLKGTDLRLTPIGVLYTKGAGFRAENGWFLAVAVKAEATTSADTTGAPADGQGWMWRGAGQTIDTVQGNATSAVWVGSVNEFGVDVPLDIPAKTGGRVLYTDSAGTVTQWALPATNAGTGLAKVRAKIKEFS